MEIARPIPTPCGQGALMGETLLWVYCIGLQWILSGGRYKLLGRERMRVSNKWLIYYKWKLLEQLSILMLLYL
jgi:hypothetical protein